MESEGLVERSRDPGDRRSFQVSLTSKGRDLFEDMAVNHAAWSADYFQGLTSEKRHTIVTLLSEFRKSLDDQ